MNGDERVDETQPPAIAAPGDTVDDKTIVGVETAYEIANRAAGKQSASSAGSRASARAGEPLGLIGDYELLDVLGMGGMGVVYRARQRRADRIVALKVMRSEQVDEEETVARFKAEAQAAARLDHPHMVTVYEVGYVDGRHFFSMRYVEGKSLAQMLGKGPLENRRAAQYLEPVARAVHEAHLQGVLHRDLKPANILVEAKTDRALVADFGLAKLQERADSNTRAGDVFGSPPYMSPEQTLDSASVTAAADVYGLGATLYHLLTDRPPFQATNVQATLRQVLEQDPPRPRSLNRQADRDLETICLKCLEKEPKRRYASAADLADELARYLRGEPILARPLNTFQRAGRWCRRKPIAAGLCAASLVAVLAVGTALLLAGQARRAGEAARKSEQLATELNRFDRFADAPSLDPAYLSRGLELAEKVAELDAPKAMAARSRLRSKYAVKIQEAMLAPKLSEPDYQSITAAIGSLAKVDETRAAELQAKLAQRRREWQELFDLRLPYANLADVFVPPLVSESGGRLVCTASKPSPQLSAIPIVFSRAPAAENTEVVATLAADWEAARELGLVLGSTVGSRQNLLLVMKTRPVGTSNQTPTFGEVRARRGEYVLEIRRGDAAIARHSLAAHAVVAGTLQLRGRREGQHVTMQINSLPPLACEEIFLTPGQDSDVVGLIWPAGVSLERLHGSRQTRATSASPLERGDELFAAGDLSGALEQYQTQAQATADKSFQQEARFKQGLCLAGLARPAEAAPVFERLSGEAGPRWPVLAATQSWLLKVRENKVAEADAILESLSSRFRFEELAAQIPADARAQIIAGYERALGSGYATIRRDPHRVRNMERLLAVSSLLEGDAHRVVDARFSLAVAYFRDERLDDARGQFQTLLTSGRLSDAGRRDVIEYVVWILLNQKKPKEAQRLLEQTLAEREGRVPRDWFPMFIECARVRAAQGEWARAAQELDLFFSVSSATSLGFYEACLARGFIRRKLGDEAGALASWREGFRKARDRNDLHEIHAAIMASLSGELTREDVNRMIAGVTSAGGDSPVMSFMSKRLVPEGPVFTVARNMWQTPRGLEYARRIALHESSFHESMSIQVLLTAHEFWRQSVVGSDDPAVAMSPEQDDVVWKLNEDLYAAYAAGTFTELHLLPIAMTYKGTTSVFGWGGVAATLPANLRGPLAYIFGRHFRNEKKTAEAIMFFETALRDAAPDSPLAKLAQADLNELKPAGNNPANGKPPEPIEPGK